MDEQMPDKIGRFSRFPSAISIANSLIAFVCLCLIGLTFTVLMQSRKHEIEQISDASKNLATSIARQIDATFSDAEHLISNLAFDIERNEFSENSLAILQPKIVHTTASVVQIKGIFVYDAVGNWLVTSEPVRNLGRNNADREYFRYHRDNISMEVHIGLPIISRTSGTWVVPVSRRLQDEKNQFAGVLLVTIDLQYLLQLYSDLNVGASGAMALTLNDHLVIRIPFAQTDPGKLVPASPLQRIFAKQQSGTVEHISPLDGVLRVISFTHVSNFPFLVTVAVGKDEALAKWHRDAIYLVVILVLLCLSIGAGGQLLRHSIVKGYKADQKLRQTRDELEIANKQLADLATKDGLTGIPNRRIFDETLERCFRHAQREKMPLALIMVDVDEFKRYNDGYGHSAGDHCLRTVAKIMRETIKRPNDLAARYGGEEFAVILPGTDDAGARQVAEAIRRQVYEQQIEHGFSAIGRVTISLGVVSHVPMQSDRADEILKRAD